MTPTKLLLGQILIVFAIVLAGLWTSTQWIAAELAYQPQLGAPWAIAFGHPVYHPWALFAWWYHFDAYAPHVFNKAGLLAGASGFVGCAAAIAGSLWRARQATHVTTYGSARWANSREIERAGLRDVAGVFLGQHDSRYLRHDGPEHIMAFAPTRSGSLAFLAGYGVRAFLIAQSLNQIEKAYGEHNAILDNCHVRVAFASNDERTAKRISDALGTATEQRSMRNYAGHRLAPWLAHVMVSRQETARALLTPGEVMQLPATDELILVSGLSPTRPVSPYMLSAGTVIAGSLITGIRSDLPGLVTAQVTEDVFDSATGRILLVPQGARLIGKYDSVVAYGQKRALVVWQRIVLPDGSSLGLENVPASDASGYAGLADKADTHSWALLKGVLISTLLGVGSELQFSGQGGLVQAVRQSGQQNVAHAGDQLTSKTLNVQPTITIRPGTPVLLVVQKDLILAPWRG